jgi:uncharacterized integral membrane protein
VSASDGETPLLEEPVVEQAPPEIVETEPVALPVGEPRGARFSRHARRARLYATAVVFVGLLVLLVVLASANTHVEKLNWVVGSTHASLAWIVLAAAVFGWLLGIATALVFQHQTRRPR